MLLTVQTQQQSLCMDAVLVYSQPAITCKKSTTETLEQGGKYVQS